MLLRRLTAVVESHPEVAYVACRTRWGEFYFVAKDINTILGNTAQGKVWANVRFISYRVLTGDEICSVGLSSSLLERALAEVPHNVNSVFIQTKVLPTIHPRLVITDAWGWRKDFAERVIPPCGLIASISGLPRADTDAVSAIVEWDETYLDEHYDITDSIGTQLAVKARRMAAEYPIETLVLLCGRNEQIDDVKFVFEKLGYVLGGQGDERFNMS